MSNFLHGNSMIFRKNNMKSMALGLQLFNATKGYNRLLIEILPGFTFSKTRFSECDCQTFFVH